MSSEAAASSTSRSDLFLPAPQKFDILPALHELLSRIDHTSAPKNLTGLVSPTSEPDDIGARYTDQIPLEPKDLPNETLQIKAKIRGALKALEKLPDMERSVEEQRVEIEELEARIGRQREMVEVLGRLAREMGQRIG